MQAYRSCGLSLLLLLRLPLMPSASWRLLPDAAIFREMDMVNLEQKPAEQNEELPVDPDELFVGLYYMSVDEDQTVDDDEDEDDEDEDEDEDDEEADDGEDEADDDEEDDEDEDEEDEDGDDDDDEEEQR
jgi:hypothetical protein